MENDRVIKIRNKVTRFLYGNLLKPLFFKFDPETVHDRMIIAGGLLGTNSLSKKLTELLFSYSNKKLEQKILSIKFSNPVGLSAGFDKDARLLNILPSVGFGFAEIGTITGEACKGNAKPRLWRLKKSKSLVVNYGLKNEGCEEIAHRLKNKKLGIPIITSIGKTNCKETAETEAGIRDYLKAYKEFTNIGQIFDINISCPNAFGGTPFSNPKKLDQLLFQVDRIPSNKPIFLKMPADLTDKQLDGILSVVRKHKIAGFICSNLTKNRNNKRIIDKVPEKGGISGKVVENLADNLIAKVYRRTKGKYIIIGCGGVFSAEDAYKKIKLGANLIQLITGMIFEGPQIIGEINQGLVRLLRADGYTNIAQAIGKGVK